MYPLHRRRGDCPQSLHTDRSGGVRVEVLCSTDAIESLNARYRRAMKARGHFPSQQAAIKCLYLVTRSLDPTGTGRTKWAMRWKPALNAFAVAFADRFSPAETYEQANAGPPFTR